ncbi:MAG: hypothetical protein ACP5OC_08935 [Thermoplasmata archaeon]
MMDTLFHKVFEVNAAAGEDALWRIISANSSIPRYWHGTRWIKNIGGERYQIRFVFPAKGVVVFVYDVGRKTAKEIYLKGPFKGEKTISISSHNDESLLRVEWNIRFSFPYSIFKATMRDHMSQGTSNAINRIIAEASKS